MHKTEILKFQDLTDQEAKGLVAAVAGKQRNIFVVRRNEKVYAYLNWCPHNQVLIDQIPDKFLNADKSYVQCSKHGALFDIESGLCIEGPCEGEHLKPLNVEIENGVIYLLE